MKPLSPRDHLNLCLSGFDPVLLDAGRRGSGWNSIWRITLGGQRFILKVYGRRRSFVREGLTDFAHWVSGCTSYRAKGRWRTESRLLRRWRESGLPVPAINDSSVPFSLSVPFLLMDYIDGRTLEDVLKDPDTDAARKLQLVQDYAEACFHRHTLAINSNDPDMLQEHPGIMHVLVSGDALVSFDLEVAFRGRHHLRERVAMELVRIVRSFFRRLPGTMASGYAGAFIDAYRGLQELVLAVDLLLNHPNPLIRGFHRCCQRPGGLQGQTDKYTAARFIRDALSIRNARGSPVPAPDG